MTYDELKHTFGDSLTYDELKRIFGDSVQEVTIPALSPSVGPYYRWSELYKYLNEKTLTDN